jgi:hypothetical protein
MSVWAFLPLVLSGLFGAFAPSLSRRLPPQVATWLLSAGGLLGAAASSASLGLLALPLVGEAPPVAASGQWSQATLRDRDPLGVPVGVLAAVAVVVLAARFVRVAARRWSAVREAYRLAGELTGRGGELCVLDSAERHALAVPGRPGRIVVTTGLLRALDADQRRALLAHERAHLEHHHHLHQAVAALAVAVNPLLRGLPPALELSCERWADESAANGSRRAVVAEALLRAATGRRVPAPGAALAAAGADVAARVAALCAPAPRLALWRVVVPSAVLTAAAVALAVAMHDTERLFELAQVAYRSARR